MTAAHDYASWVLDPANAHRTGRLIKLAAQRFFDDLKRGDIYFDEVEANRICIFAENYCCLWEDKWRGKPVKLELWQKFALQNMYGWFVKSTGLRRFKKGYIQIAKKNAKTTLGGGVIGNFHLFADERIKTPKIFVGANNEDQAKLCVNITGKVIEQSPALYEYVEDDSVRLFRYKENIVNIVHTERDGFIKALSKETGDRTSKTAGGKHGINPSLGIIDEYGMAQDDNLLNTIESAMAGREEPFVLIITTSGFYLQGPCHDKLRKIGIAILEGTMTDDSYLALIYEIDPPKPGEITVDWLLANENVWEQANPNIDVSVFRTFLRDQLIAAKNEGGSKEVSVMTLNFNRWMESAEVFIPADIWNTNSHESKIESGSECYGGLWVGASGEISAFALLFPGEIVKIKMLFWMAEDSLKMNDTLRQYKEFIKVDPGNVVDNDIAVDWIVDMVGKYNMHSFCFPKPQENNSIIQDLIKLGYTGQPLSQGLSSLAQPTDHWEKLIRSGKAEHFNNPVLKWMNSNCMATRKEAGTKIDNNPKVYGISACINAVAQWDLIAATDYDDSRIEIWEVK
jgi:phage terminase large subunit-like protein